jgi:hypothetical protein
MPVICRDKVRLGIARRDIGKRSSWIAMDAQLVRQRCDTCLSQKAAMRTHSQTRTPPLVTLWSRLRPESSLQSLRTIFFVITALFLL